MATVRRKSAGVARPSVSLEGFGKYMGLDGCLKFMTRQLGKLDLRTEDLPAYLRRIYRDLWSPLDEQALAEMHNYWEYDIARLQERGRGWREGIPAKPRIDVQIELTSKGNLKAEWFPHGVDRWENARRGPPDFLYWSRHENRSGAFDSRPSNELFFIHDVRDAIHALAHAEPRSLDILSHVALAGCVGVIDLLKERLEPHFEVTMLTDVFTEWEENEDRRSWIFSAKILKWEIDSPQARLEASERAELDQLEARLGFSESALIGARESEMSRKKTGPPPAAHTLHIRVATVLKKQGYAATPTKVARGLELVERYRSTNVVSLIELPDKGTARHNHG